MLVLLYAGGKSPWLYLSICMIFDIFSVTPPAPLLKSCQRKEEEDENEETKTFEVSPPLSGTAASASGFSVPAYILYTQQTHPSNRVIALHPNMPVTLL